MQGIEVTLKRNKQYTTENSEEYEIIAGENNATTILVHFPEEYKEFSKRVDFKNIKKEKWTIPLYTPEDETKTYGTDFDKLNFAFTLPTPVTINGELQIQFIAYLADNTETFVPFKLLKIIVEDSIMYVKKEGSENPDLILQAYEYANMSLELSREALDKTANSERAALAAEASAKAAEKSASSAQSSATNAMNSATSANTRAANAETSAKAAQESAEYAESVADSANEKSNNAVATSNSANTKSTNAVSTANEANTKSTNAVNTANTANTKSDNAVSVADEANEKSDNAVKTANEAKTTAEEALNQVVEKMGTKVYVGDATTPENDLNFSSDPQNQITENKTNIQNNANEIIKIKNNTTTIANSSGGFSCGTGATNGKDMNFRGFTICDENGKIPIARLFDAIYPVGSVYISVNSTSPQTLFGGTWVQLQDRFLLGAGTTYSNGATGGNKDAVAVSHNHTITQNVGGTFGYGGWGTIYGNGYTSAPGDASGNITLLENYNSGIGDWSGSGNSQRGRNVYAKYNIPNLAMANAGESGTDKNMPPYLVVYMWKRTA